MVCKATDGAPVMRGITNGVVAKLIETCKQQDNHYLQHFYCIIHQQSLFSKVIRMDHVIKKMSKIVYFLQARGLNHR